MLRYWTSMYSIKIFLTYVVVSSSFLLSLLSPAFFLYSILPPSRDQLEALNTLLPSMAASTSWAPTPSFSCTSSAYFLFFVLFGSENLLASQNKPHSLGLLWTQRLSDNVKVATKYTATTDLTAVPTLEAVIETKVREWVYARSTLAHVLGYWWKRFEDQGDCGEEGQEWAGPEIRPFLHAKVELPLHLHSWCRLQRSRVLWCSRKWCVFSGLRIEIQIMRTLFRIIPWNSIQAK